MRLQCNRGPNNSAHLLPLPGVSCPAPFFLGKDPEPLPPASAALYSPSRLNSLCPGFALETSRELPTISTPRPPRLSVFFNMSLWIALHLTSHQKPKFSPTPHFETHLLMNPNTTPPSPKKPPIHKPSLAAPCPPPPLTRLHPWTPSPTPSFSVPIRFQGIFKRLPEHLLTLAATHPRLFLPEHAPHPPPPFLLCNVGL